METVVLLVRVLDSESGVVDLGSTPLVVPQFYALSNAIDGSVLSIRTGADLVCTVRLMTSDTNVPALGQLVKEDSTQRKSRSTSYSFTPVLSHQRVHLNYLNCRLKSNNSNDDCGLKLNTVYLQYETFFGSEC